MSEMSGMSEMAPVDHSQHDMSGQTDAAQTPATLAYKNANTAMHSAMNIAFSGDADLDFILGMVAHHTGAVEMAQIVLEHGKDAEVRALAEGVITQQQAEITWMKQWLATHQK
jgi:uncharacterized protein (DUF305 family)